MMKVSEYKDKYILSEYRQKFMELMIQWDGRCDVGSSFYDLDVLEMKHRESME